MGDSVSESFFFNQTNVTLFYFRCVALLYFIFIIQLFIMNYTPEIITELPKNSIFVFGSNQYAIHGAGSAKAAVDKFGAIYKDVPIGLCGQSYGIITKSFNDTTVTLNFIKQQIEVLYSFAKYRPELTFYVTKIGTALAGFTIHEIASIFKSLPTPSNIILPKEFSN